MAEGHWEKLRCQAVYARILKTPIGKNEANLGGFQPAYPVFDMGGPKRTLLALFWPFFGPWGVKGRSENANLAATRKPHMKMGPTQLDY